MPRGRRRARRLAFQAAFMMDARAEWVLALARRFLAQTRPSIPEPVFVFSLRLIETLLAHRATVDTWLDGVHPRWRLRRMRAEDRNLLRLGVAELWYHPDVPPKAAINEWIELAKRYGGDEAPRFVNGILDRAAHETHAEPRLD